MISGNINNKKEDELKNKNEGIEWLTLEEAYKRNQKKPKKIFVDVFTDWCGWCKKMDKSTFTDPDVKEYVKKNYYAVKLNAESDKEMLIAGEKMTESMVARAFRVSSYPTIVLIQEDFKTILPVPGYREPKEFLTVLKQFKEAVADQKEDTTKK
jgi:thioredoxin-related protein